METKIGIDYYISRKQLIFSLILIVTCITISFALLLYGGKHFHDRVVTLNPALFVYGARARPFYEETMTPLTVLSLCAGPAILIASLISGYCIYKYTKIKR